MKKPFEVPPGGLITKPIRPPDFPKIPWRMVAAVLGAVFILFVLKGAFIVVQAGERAVIYSKLSGVLPYQLAEGLHFNIPIIREPIIYDTKTLTYTMSGGTNEADNHRGRGLGPDGQVPDDSLIALTSDGLPVTLDLSVRFHVDPDNVWRLHQDIGPEYVDKVVRPQSRAVARMAFAQFPVIDVYSGKRQVVVEQIARELRPRMANAYLILDEVLLRDIRFPDEFQSAIEQKQVAQQAAQQMVYEVQRAESEKQQKIIEAQGEASAIGKKALALAAHPQLLQYEYVQRLPDNVRVTVIDGKAIINMGDAFTTAPPAVPGRPAPSTEGGGQ